MLTVCGCCCRPAEASPTYAPFPAQPSLEADTVLVVPLNSAASNSQSAALNPGQAVLGDWVVCSSNSSSSDDAGEQLPCFVVLDDTWQGTSDLAELFAGMQRPCFGLLSPQVRTQLKMLMLQFCVS